MSLIQKIRSNIFLFAIVVLTITLLITFGIEQADKKGQKKVDLVNDFYSSTFKPIFASNKIKKQDVLNFALDGDLLLDSNQNRVLKIKNDSLGNELLGIGGSSTNRFSDYYSSITKKLNLNNKRKLELDSILNIYASSLSNSIYTDENKVFAVDPQIGKVRTNLNRDLALFLRNDKPELKRVPASESIPSSNLKTEKRDFYLFTPDTVVKRKYGKVAVSNADNNENLEKFSGTFGIDLKSDNEFFKFQIDSNFVNVNLDNILNKSEFDDINFLKAYFNDDLNLLNMSFEVQSDSSDNFKLKFSYDDSTGNDIRYEINSDNIDETVSKSVKMFSGKSIGEWIDYGLKMDSIKNKESKSKTKSNSKSGGK